MYHFSNALVEVAKQITLFLSFKKQDVYSKIQTTMGEIHRSIEHRHKKIVEQTNAALMTKKKTVALVTELNLTTKKILKYIADIEEKMMKLLDGNNMIHII